MQLRATLPFIMTVSSACALYSCMVRAADTAEGADPAEIEAVGASIRSVNIHVDNVFDLSQPGEDKRLYRFANRIHVLSRKSTIEDILLFEPGDDFSARLLEETARILRSRGFIAEADLTPSNFDPAANEVTVDVLVKDAWSLSPDLKLGRSGGENEVAIGLEEENLFGLGKSVNFGYSSDVDRDQAIVGYSDANVRGTRTRLDVSLAHNSDGERQAFVAERPFFALDSRWSIGSSFVKDSRIDSVYGLGEVIDEFQHDAEAFSLYGGWSRGLIDDRSRRWQLGIDYEQSEYFGTADVPNPLILPEQRKLVFPWVGLQLIEDDYRQMSELNDMGRTEDVFLGLDARIQIGFASQTFGSDRLAQIVRASIHKGWEPNGSGTLLLFDATASTRRESAETRNTVVTSSVRYYRRNLDRHLFLARFNSVIGNRLDADEQILLGGDNDLRGYPLRYQSGEKSASLTIEQRFFTNWYPFRLLKIGYAVFYDIGRVWGEDARGVANFGTLHDIGAGLRLTSPRSTGNSVIHIDLAFPLNRPNDIDSVQLLIERKRSF